MPVMKKYFSDMREPMGKKPSTACGFCMSENPVNERELIKTVNCIPARIVIAKMNH